MCYRNIQQLSPSYIEILPLDMIHLNPISESTGSVTVKNTLRQKTFCFSYLGVSPNGTKHCHELKHWSFVGVVDCMRLYSHRTITVLCRRRSRTAHGTSLCIRAGRCW